MDTPILRETSMSLAIQHAPLRLMASSLPKVVSGFPFLADQVLRGRRFVKSDENNGKP